MIVLHLVTTSSLSAHVRVCACRFNRILREKPRFPSFVGANAKDIVLKLMEHDVTRRLGCMADGEHESMSEPNPP